MRALALVVTLLGGCTLIFGNATGSKGDLGCTCDSPPKSSCIDSGTLRAYVANGTCSGDSCDYAYTDTLCVQGCDKGACIGADPCDGITCNTPPAPGCSDAETLDTYSISGTCFLGECSYTSTAKICANGCEGMSCLGTSPSCDGLSCTTPPPSTCTDSSTLAVYAGLGTCAAGLCSYSPSLTLCANGCFAGACNADPCAGVECIDPPAPTCIDSDTRQSYGNDGTCNAGECTYSATNDTCSYGCLDGACQPNPCAGVTCTGPGHSTASCLDGQCGFTCAAGYEVCGGYSCLASCSVTSPFTFPATGDTVTDSGAGVIGGRTTTLASVTQFTSTWQIEDLLANGCTLDYDIYLNDTLIGTAEAIGNTMTPTLSLSFTFPAIVGPTYLIEYRPASAPPSGCGAVQVVLDTSTVTLQ